MANFSGTAGNNFIHVVGDGQSGAGSEIALATNSADTMDVSQGGNDTIFAGGGDDTMNFGAAFTSKDKIDGQAGTNDIVNLAGDYSAGVKFGATTMVNIERLNMAAGNSYKLTLNDATIVAGNSGVTFDASALGAANNLILDASAETNGVLIAFGGAGDDVVQGGAWGNAYHFETGGHDTAVGAGIGADGFYMGAAFDARDRLDGVGGIFDTLFLDGDYSHGVKFKAHTLENTPNINVATGHDYKLTLHENTVGAAKSLTLDATVLGAANKLTFNAAADTDGTFTVTGGAGNDVLVGGQHANVFNLSGGGNDSATGGAGHDQFNFNGAFTLADHIDGGVGATDDLLIIGAIGPQVMTLGAANVANIGTLQINGGAYTITALDDLVGAGKTMTVTMFAGSDPLNFDGSAETNGAYVLNGGTGNDVLKGGAGNDTLKGRGGKDAVTLGGGHDTVAFNAVLDSTSTNYDTVAGFDFSADDKFDTTVSVTGTDMKVASGFLDSGTFDANLGTAVGVTKLLAGHAVLFTPDSGNLATHTFLIVDANGSPGYQANVDYVIELTGAGHTNNIDMTDFI